MPKNIVVGFDGSWQNSATQMGSGTNIHALLQMVSNEKQIGFYRSGVGSASGLLDKWINGATGKGIFGEARLAWQDIARNYQNGDDIYIFGYSRGAFTAKLLASMIVRHGLSGWQGSIEEEFRNWLTSLETPCTQPRGTVHFLGLFDCVPGNQFYQWRDRNLYLNQNSVESGVHHVRHAVASLERRWAYRPLLLSNSGQHRSFEQHWFHGYHGDIGGGRTISNGISSYVLWWMMREAFGLGLVINNVSCAEHKLGNILGVIQYANPADVPNVSDDFITRLGLVWDRRNRETIQPTLAPKFEDLDECPVCGKDMFDYLATPFGKSELQRIGLPVT
jgi:uncharacterized protein (DUF2235 family)